MPISSSPITARGSRCPRAFSRSAWSSSFRVVTAVNVALATVPAAERDRGRHLGGRDTGPGSEAPSRARSRRRERPLEAAHGVATHDRTECWPPSRARTPTSSALHRPVDSWAASARHRASTRGRCSRPAPAPHRRRDQLATGPPRSPSSSSGWRSRWAASLRSTATRTRRAARVAGQRLRAGRSRPACPRKGGQHLSPVEAAMAWTSQRRGA